MTNWVKEFIESNIVDIENERINKVLEKAYLLSNIKLTKELISILEEIGLKPEKNFYYQLATVTSPLNISRIKCYNTGFGDSFLCKGNNDNSPKMLVDCGTCSNLNTMAAVASDICEEFGKSGKKYIMISHLHEDHYNGITKLFENYEDLKIDALYLPNYISNGSLEIFAEIIFADSKSKLSVLAQSILRLPGLFQNHFETGAKIHFLSEGGVVANDLCVFRTLLPRRTLTSQNTFVDNATIKDFCKKYRDIFKYKEDESGNVEVSVNLNLDYDKQISDLISNYLNVDEIIPVSKDELKAIKKQFNTRRNELSLAFHEIFTEDENNVLFFGDAVKKDVKYVCEKYANDHYAFIKIPHHGTRKYFYEHLPGSKYYAISNGDANDSWEISARYDCRYGRSVKFICTNNTNCELCKNGCSCNSLRYNQSICGIELFHEIKI